MSSKTDIVTVTPESARRILDGHARLCAAEKEARILDGYARLCAAEGAVGPVLIVGAVDKIA